jgi:hypothetical protein
MNTQREEYPFEERYNPREFDNLGSLEIYTDRRNLGDPRDYSTSNYESWKEHEKDIFKSGALFVLPIYLYSHGGITISTTPFSCSWDSCQVGFMYVMKDKVRNEYSCKRITKKVRDIVLGVIEAEVREYAAYIEQ